MKYCKRCNWPVKMMHGKVYWQDPNDCTMFHTCKTKRMRSNLYFMIVDGLDKEWNEDEIPMSFKTFSRYCARKIDALIET